MVGHAKKYVFVLYRELAYVTPRDSMRCAAWTKVLEDNGDDRRGRSNVRRTDAPIGQLPQEVLGNDEAPSRGTLVLAEEGGQP